MIHPDLSLRLLSLQNKSFEIKRYFTTFISYVRVYCLVNLINKIDDPSKHITESFVYQIQKRL